MRAVKRMTMVFDVIYTVVSCNCKTFHHLPLTRLLQTMLRLYSVYTGEIPIIVCLFVYGIVLLALVGRNGAVRSSGLTAVVD